MRLVFYSIVLNQHQAPVADALWELTNHNYTFVELINLGDNKGGTEDYSTRPYLLRAWENEDKHQKAMELARTADCCVFSGIQSLPYMKERMKLGLLSFDMSERWLKQGLKNALSPAISKMLLAYYLGRWKHKPLYKLCMSAYAKHDHERLGMYKGKCYKWGYFTKLPNEDKTALNKTKNCQEPVRMMWCARFIVWKHPELSIMLVKRLKAKGKRIILDMYGTGELQNQMKDLAKNIGVEDCVSFRGNLTNDEIHLAMREHDIFLFTSDKKEGWGAVANEAMSEGCCVVGNDVIGSVPYLIKDGVTGCQYHGTLDSLTQKVQWLLDNPEERARIAANGKRQIQEVWNPENAAQSLLHLIDDLRNKREIHIKEGPCSKA